MAWLQLGCTGGRLWPGFDPSYRTWNFGSGKRWHYCHCCALPNFATCGDSHRPNSKHGSHLACGLEMVHPWFRGPVPSLNKGTEITPVWLSGLNQVIPPAHTSLGTVPLGSILRLLRLI